MVKNTKCKELFPSCLCNTCRRREMDRGCCIAHHRECQLVSNDQYHGPATIVYWADGEKTVVKCMDADTFDPMAGFCAALAKKVYGSTGTVKQIIKASNYEDSQALPFQGESVKDIATRAMAMLLTDVMKGD